jgi:hypothetical protein
MLRETDIDQRVECTIGTGKEDINVVTKGKETFRCNNCLVTFNIDMVHLLSHYFDRDTSADQMEQLNDMYTKKILTAEDKSLVSDEIPGN